MMKRMSMPQDISERCMLCDEFSISQKPVRIAFSFPERSVKKLLALCPSCYKEANEVCDSLLRAYSASMQKKRTKRNYAP